MSDTLATPRCPRCGEVARWSVEWCPGGAELAIDEAGRWEYAGGTEFFYDGQVNEIDIEVSFGARTPEDAQRFMLLGCGLHEWESELRTFDPRYLLPKPNRERGTT